MNINKITNNTWQLLNQKKGLTAKDVRICKEFKPLKNDITSIDITKIKKDNITKEIELIKFKNHEIGTIIKEFKKKKLISTTLKFTQKNQVGNLDIQKYTKNRIAHTNTKENTLIKSSKPFYEDITKYSKLKTTVEFSKKGLKQTQQFNLYTPNAPTKELKLNLSMSKSGKISEISTTSKNIEQSSLDILKNNHYAATCTFDNENFVRTQHYQAAKNQNVENEKTSFLFAQNMGSVMGKEISGYASGKKLVKIKVDDNISQRELIDTLNHEYRHIYQQKMISDFKNIFKRKKLTSEEKTFAKNCIDGNKKYTKKVFDNYYNNFLEIDAREAGLNAAKDYAKTMTTLYKEFNISDYFISNFKKI